MITIPKDPSLKDLQLMWESIFWYKNRGTWYIMSRSFETWMKFFGAERKPRDIFRSDVLEYIEWMRKKGNKESSIKAELERGRRFYRHLDERELVEKDFNPFKFQL